MWQSRRRQLGVCHAATIGVENRVSTIGSASATPGRANLRRMVAFVFVRPPRCRHGFARSRHALTPTASGLMTARPPRQRRSSSESPRERKMGSAIVCGMGRCRATTAEVHNHRQRMSESDTRSGCPVVRRCPALEFRRAFRCRGYCLPPNTAGCGGQDVPLRSRLLQRSPAICPRSRCETAHRPTD